MVPCGDNISRTDISTGLQVQNLQVVFSLFKRVENKVDPNKLNQQSASTKTFSMSFLVKVSREHLPTFDCSHMHLVIRTAHFMGSWIESILLSAFQAAGQGLEWQGLRNVRRIRAGGIWLGKKGSMLLFWALRSLILGKIDTCVSISTPGFSTPIHATSWPDNGRVECTISSNDESDSNGNAGCCGKNDFWLLQKRKILPENIFSWWKHK